MNFDPHAIQKLAEAWASIDGKFDPGTKHWKSASHKEGYYEEAKELLTRLHHRGYRLVRARDLLLAD